MKILYSYSAFPSEVIENKLYLVIKNKKKIL